MQHVALAFELGRAALLQVLLEPLEPPLGDAEVGEDQLVFHRLRVARRIDRARRMRDGRIVERAQDVDERVGVLVGGDVDERLRAAGPPGDREVGELDRRRHALFRVVHRGQAIEPRVGHLRNADRRLRLCRAPRAPVSRALVISWNRVDFPLEPKPMRAALSMANHASYHCNRRVVGDADSGAPFSVRPEFASHQLDHQ